MIERMNFSYDAAFDASQITGQVWCGATLSSNDIPMLVTLDIKRVVNVEMFQAYPLEGLARAGIDFVSFPIRDINEPLSDRVIDSVVAAIYECASCNSHVYVHCTAGWQRSPAVVACYLVYTGMAAERALALVKQKRPAARFYSSHIASVMRYEMRLRSRTGGLQARQ